MMYDVIVVGARCAGSPTAMLLARKGYRVLLVDRATFPSDSFRNHFILRRGVERLKRWGLMDRVLASNCPPVTKYTFDFGDFPLIGTAPQADGIPGELGPRRFVLDKILVDAAVEAGAEFREGFSVRELVMDGERVTGIRGQSKGGPEVTEKARIVIGADGLHSLVARSVQAPAYNERPPLTCAYYSYWSGTDVAGLEIYFRDDCYTLAFPTNNGLACIAAACRIEQFPEYRADIEGHFFKTLQLSPELSERVRNGKREERFVGSADLPNFFRKPYGPGWALVGDAGLHKDPVLAHGISDAFRDVELLTGAVDKGLSGQQSLEQSLADYERQRNEAVMPGYEATISTAAFTPYPADFLQLRAALRGNQADTDRLLGVNLGTVPAEEFFAPQNIARIMGTARRDA